MASIIKRCSTGDSLFFGSTTNTVSIRSFRSNPLTVYVFGTFHHRDPRATNARAEFKGTGHTQLSSSRHFICKPTYPLYLHKPYQTYHTFKHLGGCPRGVMVKAMNCGIVVREFVLQSRYYVHFRANTLGKGMNPLILPPAMGK